MGGRGEGERERGGWRGEVWEGGRGRERERGGWRGEVKEGGKGKGGREREREMYIEVREGRREGKIER